MKKKTLITILAILTILILGPAVYFRIIKPNKVLAGWFNDSWLYRKAITFNNSGSAVTNQKVKLDVNTAASVDPNTANFNTADLTFTPNVAKRNAGTGSSSPFASGVMLQRDYSQSGSGDLLNTSRGTQINGNFYQNIDANQGSIALWYTPEVSNPSGTLIDVTKYELDLYVDSSSVYFRIGAGGNVSKAVSWSAGNTYLIVARWDFDNTLNGTNYASISVNDSHQFGYTSASVDAPESTIEIGNRDSGTSVINGIIEGLTIYRRPLWDGEYGINVGNGDEISQIFNSGVGQDPTLITGSWDVVFDLPTNASTGSLGTGGPGQAWSHPHSSNVLYTSTTNTGGFMMGTGYSVDGWTDRLNGGGAITVGTAPVNQKIYAGGYQVTSDGATASQGIGRSASGLTAGENYVVRALAHSDGTSIPQVQIWDLTNNAEITSLTGTVGSGRTGPDTLIFTFELPTVARNGVATSCTNFDVRLLNTQTSGTVYWHQVEVLANLVDNPSLDVGSSATGPWIPDAWSNKTGDFALEAGEGIQETDIVHSGTSSMKLYTNLLWEGIQTPNVPLSYGKYFSSGFFGYQNVLARLSDWSFPYQHSGNAGNWTRSIPASWTRLDAVTRDKSGWSSGSVCSLNGSSTPTGYYYDDFYTFLLTDVSLTVTPASLANSTETTGIRVDGRDTATASISNLTTTTGTIKFNYTPRHSAADSNKFVESGTVTDDVYLGEWYGDADDYIKLYWDSANTMALKYSMAGVGGSGTWNATGGITAGTTYSMKIDYTGGSTMTLGVGNTSAITLSSIPSAFGTKPSTAYWGTNSSSTGQADATYAQTTVSTGVKMKSNCDDIRFTDQNGNLLDYYYDSTNGPCNTETTDFYVLMPNINAGQNTVYMYYGNQSATKGSKSSQFSQSTFSQSSTTYSTTEEQSKGPIAYWALDDGQGTVARDSSATARNDGVLGTGTSAPAWQTEDMCVAGKCLKFDGNDFVSRISTDSLRISADLTLGAWVYLNTTGAEQTVLGKWDESNNTRSYRLWISSTNKLSMSLSSDGTSGNTTTVTGSTSLSANKWYYLQGVADVGSNLKVYIDGKQDGSDISGNPSAISANQSVLYIGSKKNSSGNLDTLLNGRIDEVKLFNYARSASEIKADYNARGSSKGLALRTQGEALQSSAAGGGSFLSEGLVGYWKMDEASWNGTANEVIDSSGNSNHGVGVGSTKPTTGAGKFGNGGVFNSSGQQYVSVADNALLSTGDVDFTICVWVKTSSGGGVIVAKRSPSGFEWQLTPGSPRFYINPGGDIADWGATTNDGNWHFICAWHDSVNNKIGLQMDGRSPVSTTTTGAPSDDNSAFQIGAAAGGYFTGTIDEIRYYKRLLSPAEVRNLYEWAPGPVAYYNFNEGVGSSAYDTSGNGNNGVLKNNPTWKTGKYGKGLNFDVTNNGYVEIANSASLRFNGSYTLEAWIRPNKTLTTGYSEKQFQTVVAKYTGGSGGYEMLINPDGNIICYYYNGTSDVNFWASGSACTAGNWCHIVCNFDSSSLKGKVFTNGVQRSSTTMTASMIGDSNETVYISWNGSSRVFEGSLDEVKIYNYARTQKQIIEDMNAGHPAGGSPLGSQVGKWQMDEGYGTSTRNSISGGVSLTLGTGASAPSWTNDGKFGKALSFDGGGDYAYTANVAMMAGNGQTYPSLAVSAWVYPQTSAASKTIIHKNNEFRMTTDSNSKVNCSIYGNGSWQTASLSSSSLSLSSWSHVLCNYDGTTLKTWVNGVGGVGVGQTAQIVSLSSTPLNIAKDATALANYQGYIDEVKVYNYSLSQDEIYTDYNQGASLVLGSLSTGSSNPAPSGAGSQEYCVPGDSGTNCSPPIGRWDFNEGVGTSAYDSSGNNNPSLLNTTGNVAPTWVKGKVGKGLNFDGINDYSAISSRSFFALTGSSFTMEEWINTRQTSYASTFVITGNVGAIGNLAKQADGTIRFDTHDWLANKVVGNKVVNDGKWHHIVGVYNVNTGIASIYVDGLLDASKLQTGTSSNSEAAIAFGCNFSYFIGGWPGNPSQYLNGILDQPRLFNYARTPSQIAWDYNQGKPVAWYDFNECQGTTLKDAGGVDDASLARNDATITIGASGTQTTSGSCAIGIGSTAAWGNGSVGKYNASLNFDGTDDYAVTSNVALMAGAGQTYPSLSFGSWVYPTTSAASKTIIQKNNEFRLTTDANSKPQCEIYAAGSWQTAAVSSSSLSLSSWSHVLCTYDGSNIKVWVNGLNTGTQAETDQLVSSSSTALSIARDSAGTGYFSGQIDEVKLWNYPLTTVLVRNEYNQGGPVRFGPLQGSP